MRVCMCVTARRGRWTSHHIILPLKGLQGQEEDLAGSSRPESWLSKESVTEGLLAELRDRNRGINPPPEKETEETPAPPHLCHRPRGPGLPCRTGPTVKWLLKIVRDEVCSPCSGSLLQDNAMTELHTHHTFLTST